MTKNFLELIIGSIDDGKQWRAYKARVKALPAPYRESAEAVERYLMSSGGIPSDGARLVGCSPTSPTCSSRPRPTARLCATSAATSPWSSSPSW